MFVPLLIRLKYLKLIFIYSLPPTFTLTNFFFNTTHVRLFTYILHTCIDVCVGPMHVPTFERPELFPTPVLTAHLLTILQVGVQESSPELLSLDQEISVLPSFRFSKHFVPRTSFNDVFFPFRWLSMLNSHLSLGLPLGIFPFIFNIITTLSVESSSLLMTWPNHRSNLLF